MPERCLRLIMGRSRQLVGMELKQPLQMDAQIRANASFKLLFMARRQSLRLAIPASAATIAVMGSVSQPP